MIPPFQLYLFDVDGTLLDSAPDICWAMRSALESEGVMNVSEDYLRTFIGYHLRDLFLDALPHYSDEQVAAMIAHYRRVYPARGHIGTRVYDGVDAALAALPGLKSTATTKATETASLMLRQFGLIGHFHRVQGTDGFPSKPDPEILLRSLSHFGVAPQDCLFVGDAAPDMEAGRKAGVRTCAVRYGYGNLEHMAAHQPDFWIDSPLELLPA